MGRPSRQSLYRIRVRGVLSETLLSAFTGLDAEMRGGETLLFGPLPDQAALYGVLAEIEAFGLELLEVHCDRPAGQPVNHPGAPRITQRARTDRDRSTAVPKDAA
jgi:hypothetical protein